MYLGIDLGTSSLKAVVINDAQAVIAEASAPLAVNRPAPGWSEQAPGDWIVAAETALRALGRQTDFAGLRSIGLSGQMHGATLLDADDAVLRACILWNDTRAYAEAAAQDSDPAFREISGNIVFPGFTAPKLDWVRTHERAHWDACATVLLPKDYLRLWLTGERVSEMSDAAGTAWFDTGSRDWSDTLLDSCGLSRGHMPTLVEGNAVSGRVRASLAERFAIPANLPVAGGGGDNAASAVGVGVVRPGEAFVSLGTSGVLFAADAAYRPAPETAVHSFCHALPDTWHQMGVILAATDALNWLARIIGRAPEALTGTLGPLQAPGGTAFLPYLGGERTPLNDAAIRGAFSGLDHATDQDALTRAVLEGVVFALADSQEALAQTGTRIDTLTAVGGGSRSDYWLAALATALDLEIAVPAGSETGAAFGAARLGMMAAEGAGAETATAPPIARRIAPDPGLRAAFVDGHARYRALRDAIGALP